MYLDHPLAAVCQLCNLHRHLLSADDGHLGHGSMQDVGSDNEAQTCSKIGIM